MRKMLSDSILDLGKCPNQKTHESENACFLVGALCEVKNRIWKHFSHKVLYNYYSTFFCVSDYTFLSQKMDFPLYFQILRRRVWVFFQARKLIFCQMACIYLLNSRDDPQSLDFVITTYSYPLTKAFLVIQSL